MIPVTAALICFLQHIQNQFRVCNRSISFIQVKAKRGTAEINTGGLDVSLQFCASFPFKIRANALVLRQIPADLPGIDFPLQGKFILLILDYGTMKKLILRMQHPNSG
ncbi:hypothetical protein D3C86_1941670 [compost metagenome]